ncbi:hypothetical protein APSETT444_003019 [Aspergillus pseudonomiae]
MASLFPQPTEAAYSTSSNTSPSPVQYTPVSDRSEDESGPLSRPPPGSLKVQTQFGANRDDRDDGYDSYDDPEEKPDTGFPKYTAIEEKQIVKKFDRRLVPFLALLYLLSFLDRSNIGNAKIAGMTDDLRLSSSQYEWLLTAFYITYILFEWMTLMYRLVPPHIYISLCVCGWGLVACFQSLATSFGGLVLLRALLGVTEAAFGPGVPFYLSLFYKREELAFRNGLFISAAPLASSFASSLAWVIVKMSSNGPIAPWRTLFLVEGFPSVIVAVFAWILIPDSPGSAWFLGPRQRMVAEQRMEENKPNHHEPRRGKFNWKEVRATLADPKSYITAVNSMGYSSVTSQALSAPPFLFAFVIVLLTAYISDRNRKRSPYLIMHALLSSASYLIIALTGHFHAHLPATAHTTIRYLCVYPATAGFFSAITLIMTWTMDNRVAKEAKGASIAIMNVIGQCGPLLGTRLYPSVDGPWYVRGMATCSFFMVVVAVLAFVLRVMLLRARRKVEAEGVEIEMDGGEESEVLMGGRNIGRRAEEKFTYII